MLTIAEVAGLLRCSKWSVYRLIATGELKAVNVAQGGRRSKKPRHRIRQHDLDAFLRSRESRPGKT
jgi:excisionase family DNA binding protein